MYNKSLLCVLLSNILILYDIYIFNNNKDNNNNNMTNNNNMKSTL